MRKFAFLLFVLVLVGTAFSPLVAQEEHRPFRIQAKTGVAASIASLYITPDLTLFYSPEIAKKWLAFGGGVKTFLGTRYGDVYVAPYGTIELAIFYLDLGIATQVKEPDEAAVGSPSSNVLAFISTGLYPRIKAGPGWIVLGGNLDIIPTASPVVEGDNFIETFFITIFGAAFNTVKAELAVGYRLPL